MYTYQSRDLTINLHLLIIAHKLFQLLAIREVPYLDSPIGRAGDQSTPLHVKRPSS